MYVCECIFVPNSSSLSAICTAVYSCKRRTCMPYVLSSVWYKASRKENEGMVGVSGESKPTRRNTLPGGMLEFVCISECFVCKSRSLIYLHECVGGKGAAEKHLELYENPGISTSGLLPIRHTRASMHTTLPSLIVSPIDSLLNTWSDIHALNSTLGSP